MIEQTQIDQVGELLSQRPVEESAVIELRQQFPHLHFTYCMDDDVIAAKPLYETDRFNLYLIDSSNHCLSFTQDLSVATGIVVAELEEA
ncbi:MAG: DUF6129 family protein [Candidatus Thiodiazotropha sp.]